MEIILLQDVEKVGEKHQIVKVKPGYARNYLIPKGCAIIANRSNRKRLSELQRQEEAKENKLLNQYREMAEKLNDQIIKIGAKSGTSGKIFGSVTNVQIAQALKEQLDIEVERKKISLPDEIKELGTYKAVLNLHREVKPEIRFEVVQE